MSCSELRLNDKDLFMKRLFFSFVCVIALFLSSCLNSSKARLSAPSCYYVKTSEPYGLFYKIVGVSEDSYSLRKCSEASLRQIESLTVEDQKSLSDSSKLIENCFSPSIEQMQFKEFENLKLIPILCDEIK